MGAFSDGLDALAALEVAGVRVHYAADETPAEIEAAALPALLILPTERGGRWLTGQGDGFSMVTLGETGAVYTAEITHLLLVSPEGRGVSVRAGLAVVVGLVDAYFAALRGDVRLGGALKYPSRVEVMIGVWPYGAGRYVAAAFRHVWTMSVEG
jgi:hypothetical protein